MLKMMDDVAQQDSKLPENKFEESPEGAESEE
jgi:hypothetical protein